MGCCVLVWASMLVCWFAVGYEFWFGLHCWITLGFDVWAMMYEISAKEIPKLAAEAATKAIQEWGQPRSCITHLIFSTMSDTGIARGDNHLPQMLGLNPNNERVVILQQDCFTGGTTLRLAKCLAESRKGARVLVAIFVDGASALIVGVNPNETIGERASFVIASASQVILPNSSHAITGHLSEGGIKATIHKDIPNIISNNIGKCLEEAFTPLGISNWNSIFWVLHPGGRAILDQLEERVGLKPEKLMISRHVLAEYGNMVGVCVYFVLDEMRKRSIEEGKTTTREGLEWGVLFGFGPGLTIETIILHSYRSLHTHVSSLLLLLLFLSQENDKNVDAVIRVRVLATAMRWKTRMLDHEDGPLVPEKILIAVKSYWVATGNNSTL
ncbi:hypothetical protein IEQ34_020295 [Dendrobium chrysotoxum]|uniref:Chalcone synthase n=1 Tax=Dendrobium chrysotoxum TaxID=161865 RepID=A0AAV7G1N1_DENCH|nr:hypothetical protein IEQ34_020295 [Dendrobium chrysotoxum]